MRASTMSRNVAGICVGAATGDQLLGEERVALRTLEHHVDQLAARFATEDRRDHLAQLFAVEALELDALRATPERSSSASTARSGWRRCRSSDR